MPSLSFRRLAVLVVTLAALVAVPTAASAATYTVTYGPDFAGTVNGVCNSAPGGLCSLREAVREANATAGPDVINMTGGHDLTITGVNEDLSVTGDLDITQPLTINGTTAGMCNGAPVERVDYVDAFNLGDRIFDVRPGATLAINCAMLTRGSVGTGGGGCVRSQNALTTTTLTYVTMSNCRTVDPGFGSAIASIGPVVLNGSEVLDPDSGSEVFFQSTPPAAAVQVLRLTANGTHFSGSNGVAVRTAPGQPLVLNGVLMSNCAAAVSAAGDVTITNTLVQTSGDGLHGFAPAIDLDLTGGGTVDIDGSVFEGNNLDAVHVLADNATGPVTFEVTNSEFTNNTFGGALTLDANNIAPTITLTNLEFVSNGHAFDTTGTPTGGTATITNVRTRSNRFPGGGSAVLDVALPGGTVTATGLRSEDDGAAWRFIANGVTVTDAAASDPYTLTDFTLDADGAAFTTVNGVRLQGDGARARLATVTSGTVRNLQVADNANTSSASLDLGCGFTVEQSSFIDVSRGINASCATTLRANAFLVSSLTTCTGGPFTSAGWNAFSVNGASCGASAATNDLDGAAMTFSRERATTAKLARPTSGDIIDFIPAALCGGTASDPSAVARPTGGGCEPGSFEAASAARADVSATMTSTATNIAAGAGATLTIRLRNAGPDLARQPSITVALPTGFTAGALPADCVAGAGTVTCDVARLRVGASSTFVVPVVAGMPAGTRSLTATAATVTSDIAADNDVASAALTVPTPPGPDPTVDPPAVKTDPLIAGDTVVGGRLACVVGVWQRADSYAFAWLQGAEPLTGANTALLKLTPAMEGRSFTCRVTATNIGGSTVAVSDTVGPVRPAAVSANAVAKPKCTINGTAKADVLRGTPKRDVICGGNGNDRILGLGGNDYIVGGAGNDIIDGGQGNDQLDGGPGVDRLLGGAGSDTLRGGAGNDIVTAGAGSDTIFGGAGDDTIDGGQGGDLANGGTGNDTIRGGLQFDVLFGGAGNDSLDGGDGNDLVTGNDGHDKLLGGPQDDTLWGGSGNDQLDGGMGVDQLFGLSGDDRFTFGPEDSVNPGDGNDVANGLLS